MQYDIIGGALLPVPATLVSPNSPSHVDTRPLCIHMLLTKTKAKAGAHTSSAVIHKDTKRTRRHRVTDVSPLVYTLFRHSR